MRSPPQLKGDGGLVAPRLRSVVACGALAAVIAVAAGCATHRYDAVADGIRQGRVPGGLVEGVPCIEQARYQCGPAALAMVLGACGETADVDAIALAVYDEERRATAVEAMAAYPDPARYWVLAGPGDVAELNRKVKAGVAAVALLQPGRPVLRAGHYYVVHGTDERQRLFLLRSGTDCEEVMGWDIFDYRWAPSGRWRMVVSPGDRVAWTLSAEERLARGLYYERGGQSGLAEADYRAAIEAAPAVAQLYINLSNLWMAQARWDEASALLETGVAATARDRRLVNSLAWVRGEQARFEEAIELAREAVGEEPATARIEYLDTLGWVLVRGGHRDEGCAWLELARRRAEESGAARAVREGLARHWAEACAPAAETMEGP